MRFYFLDSSVIFQIFTDLFQLGSMDSLSLVQFGPYWTYSHKISKIFISLLDYYPLFFLKAKKS